MALGVTRMFLSTCSRSTVLISLPIPISRTSYLSVSNFLRHCHRHRLHAVRGNAVEADSFSQSSLEEGTFDEKHASSFDAVRSNKQKNEPDYLSLSDEDLLAQCKMDTYRASGPGGQHRNKTDSAVRLRHISTGLVSQAAEDRSQHRNRQYALKRLRQAIALKVRHPIELENYQPPPELVRILALAKGLGGNVQQIGPQHQDFPKGVQHLMDLLWQVGGSVSDAAKLLGLSTGALSKVITSDKLLWQSVNQLRASKGMKPLR